MIDNPSAFEARASDERPRDDGRKVYGAGVALLTLGATFGVTGTALLGVFLFAPEIYLPVLLPGVGMIVGGSFALKHSFRRQTEYRRAWGLPPTSKLRLAPTFDVGRHGGHVGLVMRF